MPRNTLWLILLMLLAAPSVRTGWGQNDSPSDAEAKRAAAPASNDADTDPEPSTAQDDERPQPDSGDPLISPEKGPLFYFLNQSGQLVVGSNIKLEDIQEYYNLKQGLRQEVKPPDFVIHGVDIQGVVTADAADLTIKFDIQVVADSEKPIPVSLGLGGIVRPEFMHQGEGRDFFVFDGESYICWLEAKRDTRHSIVIRAAASVERFDTESNLSFSLPYAASKIQLDLPLPNAIVAINDRRSSVTARAFKKSKTQAIVDSRGGELVVRWSPQQDTTTAKTRPLIFAHTSLRVRIENPLLMQVEAEIEARAARGEMDAFDVLLPPGVKLIPRRPTGYQVSIAGVDGQNPDRQRVRIKLDTPAQRAPRIVLAGEITRTPDQANAACEVWGFEVVGAQQTGSVALIAGEDWIVTPMTGASARRDRSPAEDPRVPANAARFQIIDQPSSLMIAVRPKATRIVIDPIYWLDVGPLRTQLDLRISCRFGNGRPLDLALPLNGWNVKEIQPERLAPAGGDFEIDGDVLTIPLSKVSDAPMGNAEITIRLERPHLEENVLDLLLPTPQASQFSPGLAIVLRAPLIVAAAANNVQLTPDVMKTPNLVIENINPDSLPESWKTRQQQPIALRAESSGAPLRFHATQQVRPRSIMVTPSLLLEFRDAEASVEELFAMEAFYEPVSRMRFLAPAAITQSSAFRVEIDGEQLAPENIDATGFDVVLPETKLGAFAIRIRHEHPLPAIEADSEKLVELPLTVPSETDLKFGLTSLRCVYEEGLQLEIGAPADDEWSESSPATRNGGLFERTFTTSQMGDTLTTRLRGAEAAIGALTVQRQWVQTWLTNQGRRERATFLIRAPIRRITLQLPPGAVTTEDLAIAVDGLGVVDRTIQQQQVSFLLPDASQNERVIEVWYRFGQTSPLVGRFNFAMPQIVDASRVDEFYWQFVTPRREHLLLPPSDLTSEMEWFQHRLAYYRRPLMTSQQLKQLTRASQIGAIPSDANRYVFSAMGSVNQVEGIVARRSWLVAGVAGLVMLLGGAWLSLHGRKRSLFFLGVSVLIASLAVVFPNPAVLVAQAGAVGLGFLGAVRFLEWMLRRERPIGVEVFGATRTLEGLTASNNAGAATRSVQSSPRSQAVSESGV